MRYFVALCMAVVAMGCCCTTQREEVVISDGLRFNESTFPYDGGLLIANFGASQLNPLNDEGRGYIAMLRGDEVSMFIPADGSLSAPKGMLVKGDYLLICDVNRLVVYNLKALSDAPQLVSFPAGELFVNDIVAKGDDIYVSVTNSGNIFKIDGSNLAKIASAKPQQWLNVVGANGLVLDGSTLYVASYPADGVTTDANVIYRVADIESPVATPLTEKAGQWDGLAISEDRKTLYSSSWSPAEVVAIDLATGGVSRLEIESVFVGAADFTLMNGALYIPDLPNSALIIYPLPL